MSPCLHQFESPSLDEFQGEHIGDLSLAQHEVKVSQVWHSVPPLSWRKFYRSEMSARPTCFLSHLQILHFLDFSFLYSLQIHSMFLSPDSFKKPACRENPEKLLADEKWLHFWNITARFWHDVWIESTTCDIVKWRSYSSLSVFIDSFLGTKADTEDLPQCFIWDSYMISQIVRKVRKNGNKVDILLGIHGETYCLDRAYLKQAQQPAPWIISLSISFSFYLTLTIRNLLSGSKGTINASQNTLWPTFVKTLTGILHSWAPNSKVDRHINHHNT